MGGRAIWRSQDRKPKMTQNNHQLSHLGHVVEARIAHTHCTMDSIGYLRGYQTKMRKRPPQTVSRTVQQLKTTPDEKLGSSVGPDMGMWKSWVNVDCEKVCRGIFQACLLTNPLLKANTWNAVHTPLSKGNTLPIHALEFAISLESSKPLSIC